MVKRRVARIETSREGPVIGKRKAVEGDVLERSGSKRVRRNGVDHVLSERTGKEGEAKRNRTDGKTEKGSKDPRGKRGSIPTSKPEVVTEKEVVTTDEGIEKVGLEKLGAKLGALIGRKRKMRKGGK